ncbi:MAG: formate dehydrogenase subunit alpha [Nitrospirae bacterium]|nr:MAG: formate dehydrogenase subunit alpha [Nitrospirota bacterium]
MQKVQTICPYCGCGCGVYLHIDGGRVVGTSPVLNHPVNEGSLCVKGYNCHEFIHHPDRLKTPLIKDKDTFRETTWEEALTTAASKLQEIIGKYGPEAIGVLGSAKCTNEENYLLMKFTRAVLKTNNIDHCARLCHSSTVGGLAAAFGSGAMTNSIPEIKDARVLFVIGSNTTESHPMVAKHMIEALDRGAILIVADPRKTQIARLSSIHLQHRPGSDVALLMGIMNVILTEKLIDREFVKRRTENFDAFEESLREFPLPVVESLTGVPAKDIQRVARIYASEKRSMLFYTMGITQHITGVDNVKALANLVMLTGHIGLPSSGLNPLRGQNNVQGACDMGVLPNVYTGYQKVTDPRARKKFSRAWRCTLPEKPGLTVVEMTEAALEGKLKAMIIMGENPLISDPDLCTVREAFERLEFLVVIDIFPNETTSLAHVLLPGASFAEKNGTFTNTERRVQLTQKAVKPPGKAMPEWQIISQLSSLMGYPMSYRETYEIMEEIALLSPSYGGILHHRLKEGHGLQWPCPNKNHPGTPYLHRKKFARGLGTFMTITYRPPAELPDDEYPFILTTGRTGFHYHTGTLCRRTFVLEREEPEPFVEVNPEDAEKLNVRDGEPVKVSSRRGEITIKVRITNRVPQGTLFIPFHFREAAANILTNPALDPSAKIPEYKVCAVKVTPLRKKPQVVKVPKIDIESLRIT